MTKFAAVKACPGKVRTATPASVPVPGQISAAENEASVSASVVAAEAAAADYFSMWSGQNSLNRAVESVRQQLSGFASGGISGGGGTNQHSQQELAGAQSGDEQTHTGDRPFGCAYCDKRFSVKSNASRHERLHSGIKPYACSYCSKRFSQKVRRQTL